MNEAQTDAELVQGSEDVIWCELMAKTIDGHCPLVVNVTNVIRKRGRFHSRLAPPTIEWNFLREQGREDQLRALVEAGYVPPESLEVPVLPARDDPTAALADRARALLDVNCASCHQPDGFANAQLDLRFGTPLPDTGPLWPTRAGGFWCCRRQDSRTG